MRSPKNTRHCKTTPPYLFVKRLQRKSFVFNNFKRDVNESREEELKFVKDNNRLVIVIVAKKFYDSVSL